MNKERKSFTLVELLVVIAILAILAVVAIIGFSSYTKKAKLSNDISLVTQVNEVLRSAETLGEVPANMFEAKELIEENTGYDITKSNTILTQYAYIGYDVRANCVVLINNLISPDTINTIIECPEGYTPYSTYDIFIPMDNVYDNLYSTYLVNATETEFETNKGLDVGECTNVTKIDYTNDGTSREVVIRTNTIKTKLSIDGSNDTIKHYGDCGSVDIISVANSSYHEFGYVPFLEISKGRIVLEKSSSVSMLYFDTKISDVTLGVKTKVANVFDDIIINIASGVTLPEFMRDSITDIPATGTLVVEVEKANNQSDYIYLYQFGLVEEIKVTSGASSKGTSQKVAFNSSAPNGNSSTLESNTQQIADDIANNLKSGVTTPTSMSDVEGGLSTQAEIEAQKDYIIRLKELAIYDSNNQFVRNMSLAAFRDSVNSGNTYEGYTIKVLQDCDYSHVDWVPIGYRIYGVTFKEFDGIFNGNNKTIKVKNSEITCCDYFGFFGEVYNVDTNNRYRIYDLNLVVDFHSSHTSMPYCVVGGLIAESYGYVGIKNVNVSGVIESNRVSGGLIGNSLISTGDPNDFLISNCHVTADVKAFSVFDSDNWLCCGGIVGQNDANIGLTIIDCSYTGNISTDFTGHTNSASSYLGYVMGKGANDCGSEITTINSFTVGTGSTIAGYQNVTTHNYPFEGYNKYSDSNTYSTAPNYNKQLVGGYFYSCTIDGVTVSEGQNFYPHG